MIIIITIINIIMIIISTSSLKIDFLGTRCRGNMTNNESEVFRHLRQIIYIKKSVLEPRTISSLDKNTQI